MTLPPAIEEPFKSWRNSWFQVAVPRLGFISPKSARINSFPVSWAIKVSNLGCFCLSVEKNRDMSKLGRVSARSRGISRVITVDFADPLGAAQAFNA
jgi:hypothetical protein